MIIDKIENLIKYTSLIKNLDNAVGFIKDNMDLPLGRHDFNGGFVLSIEADSTPSTDKDYEAHRDYVDVMLMTHTEETVSYKNTVDLTLIKEYNEQDDVALYQSCEAETLITVPKGYFYTVQIGEGNKPCVHKACENSKPVKKYIVKCKQTK